MSAIDTFSVRIKTGTGPGPSKDSGPGTDGDVYIGLCGREFYIDSADPDYDDFEEGDDKTYIFGSGHNVWFPNKNDPRSGYPVFTEDIDLTPAYIRFAPTDRKDEWHLESVTVLVNNGEAQLQALEGDDHLWLGTHMGLYCYLWTVSPVGSPRKLYPRIAMMQSRQNRPQQ